MKDFRNGEHKEKVWYQLCFFFEPGGGSAFPCDENGNVLFDQMQEPAVRNYERCMAAGPEHFPVAFAKVERNVHRYREPNSGICNCGKRIELHNEYMGACECPHCGQWWNVWGAGTEQPENMEKRR